MLSLHILSENDGAERAGGVRGIVTACDQLYYTVYWEDGSTSEHQRGDPDVWGFEFPQRQGRPTGALYHQIEHDARLWAGAGPRPERAAQNDIYPIEADVTGYGWPDERTKRLGAEQ